jgi:hypothetical protein
VTPPALTALVPVKRYHRRYLLEAIMSLRAQTSPDWRGLIIHAPGLAGELKSVLCEPLGDPRLQLIEQRGRKLAGAFNTGMRAARTEFTAILLGDDLWAPEAVEVISSAIAAHPEVDFFHSARRIVDDRGAPVSGIHGAEPELTAEMFIDRGPVKHLLCWRRELALSIGGMDESLNSVGPDDYDFPWSMFEAGARFAALQDCLYVYRDHRAFPRLTTHLPLTTHVRETRRILRKHGVSGELIEARLAAARAGYLRQCLYSNRRSAWLGRLLRRDPERGWRDRYG